MRRASKTNLTFLILQIQGSIQIIPIRKKKILILLCLLLWTPKPLKSTYHAEKKEWKWKRTKGRPIHSAIQRWTVAGTHVASGKNEYQKRRTQLFSFPTSFQASKIFSFKAVREKSRPLWSLIFGTKGAMIVVFFWVAFHSVEIVNMPGTRWVVTSLQKSFRKHASTLPSGRAVPLISHRVIIYLSPGQF